METPFLEKTIGLEIQSLSVRDIFQKLSTELWHKYSGDHVERVEPYWPPAFPFDNIDFPNTKNQNGECKLDENNIYNMEIVLYHPLVRINIQGYATAFRKYYLECFPTRRDSKLIVCEYENRVNFDARHWSHQYVYIGSEYQSNSKVMPIHIKMFKNKVFEF